MVDIFILTENGINMTLLHYGIRGGAPGIGVYIFIIVGVVFYGLLAIATKGFKHPSNNKKKD